MANDGLRQLTPEEQEALDRVLVRLAENADGVERMIDLAGHLSRSGVLAGLQAGLEDLDENFSAAMRPELMGMVANLMMLLGLMSQVSYEPFFDLAMRTAPELDDGYRSFQEREDKLGIREAVELMRTPEVAALLQTMVAVLRAQRGRA
ncbi:MAG TPA: hypothetical protein VH650_12500 [Gaiellaceae bacterium]|jgi:uncharacterized protein YjgD (DUF1641 family)